MKNYELFTSVCDLNLSVSFLTPPTHPDWQTSCLFETHTHTPHKHTHIHTHTTHIHTYTHATHTHTPHTYTHYTHHTTHTHITHTHTPHTHSHFISKTHELNIFYSESSMQFVMTTATKESLTIKLQACVILHANLTDFIAESNATNAFPIEPLTEGLYRSASLTNRPGTSNLPVPLEACLHYVSTYPLNGHLNWERSIPVTELMDNHRLQRRPLYISDI